MLRKLRVSDATVTQGSSVMLMVAAPYPRIPSVVGKLLSTAKGIRSKALATRPITSPTDHGLPELGDRSPDAWEQTQHSVSDS